MISTHRKLFMGWIVNSQRYLYRIIDRVLDIIITYFVLKPNNKLEVQIMRFRGIVYQKHTWFAVWSTKIQVSLSAVNETELPVKERQWGLSINRCIDFLSLVMVHLWRCYTYLDIEWPIRPYNNCMKQWRAVPTIFDGYICRLFYHVTKVNGFQHRRL